MPSWSRSYKGRPLQKESEIQRSIIECLKIYENMHKLIFVRNNSYYGKIIGSNGQECFLQNRKKGSSDIFVFIRGGKTLFFEVKSEKGKLSSDQIDFKNSIENLGFEYYIVRDVETANKILMPYL
jgi:hypothetical protein